MQLGLPDVELGKKGLLHERAVRAVEQTQDDLLSAVNQAVQYQDAWEAVRERYLFLPSEEDVPNMGENPQLWSRNNRRIGRLRWWQSMLGILALWILLDFGFANGVWPGMAVLGLFILAVFARNRLPWVTTAIETLGGLVLLIIVYLNILGWAVSGGFLRAWMAITMYAVCGVLFVAWLGLIISRRLRKRP